MPKPPAPSLPVPPIPPSIYLDGGAWACGFLVGVHKVFVEYWGQDFAKKCIIQGDSAGALMALVFAANLPTNALEYIYECCVRWSYFRLSDIHDAIIDAIYAVEPELHINVRGRLQLGVTYFPRKHEWVTEFRDKEHVRQTLHASMHIPFYCRKIPIIDNQSIMDGAISTGGRHLAHGDNTLLIGPMRWCWKVDGRRSDPNDIDIMTSLNPLSFIIQPRSDGGKQFFEEGELCARRWFETGRS